jgi:hypothetical protein
VNKQVERPVQHVINDRILTIDLVDDHNRAVPQCQGFSQHECRLRHGTFLGVHQQQDSIYHPEGPLDLTAKVGVPRRIDQIDFDAVIRDARILGANGDPTFPFLIHRIQDPLPHLIDLTMDAGLAQHGINQSRLAVVNVGDDGDVTDVRATGERAMRRTARGG